MASFFLFFLIAGVFGFRFGVEMDWEVGVFEGTVVEEGGGEGEAE